VKPVDVAEIHPDGDGRVEEHVVPEGRSSDSRIE
jgi:hypothetical protein